MVSFEENKKHNLTTSRNTRHTLWTLQNLILSFLWILFSTIAKMKLWSSNDRHLFTSKALCNYENHKSGNTRGEGERAWKKNLLQGNIVFLMSSQTFENDVHFWECSWFALKESETPSNNKSVLYAF